METTQRMVPLSDGSGDRAGIKLDTASWTAIEWLAAQEGITWQQWCLAVIKKAPEGVNLTATVRSAAMDAILNATVFADRAEAFASPQALGFSMAGVCWRPEDFQYALDQATVIEGRQDLGSVEIISGIDEFGRVCFYVRNKLEDCPSMTISVPLKPEQWLEQMESPK
jgi:hypothetical protein